MISDYNSSLNNPESFFLTKSKKLSWSKSPSISIKNRKFFTDGELNASFNCLDRHDKNKIAIIDSKNDGSFQNYTYGEVTEKVSALAHTIKILKPTAVTIYMPMSAEACFAALACSRAGITHNVVFGGYSADSLNKRINDSKSQLIITVESAIRETKKVEFLENVTLSLKNSTGDEGIVKNVILMQNLDELVNLKVKKELAEESVDGLTQLKFTDESDLNGINFWCYKHHSTLLSPVSVNSNHPLFYLYTSGSTGNPKGLVHSTGGYLLWAMLTLESSFNFDSNSVMLCTADLGWITGHSYTLYGPLLFGATTVILGGTPLFPSEVRLFELIDKFKVTHLYTAPTAIRVLKNTIQKKDLNDLIKKNYKMKSLKLLGSVGEPINSEAWHWFSNTFNQCPVIDTYFQTETGGFVITPVINETKIIPECAGHPCFGIKVKIMPHNEATEENLGLVYLEGDWPGRALTILNDDARWQKYFDDKYYITGDEGFENEDGVWIRGRADDVLNVSGHRFSTAELESAVCSAGINECAVVGMKDPITGQSIVVFAVSNQENTEEIVKKAIRTKIGPIATPKKVIKCTGIPKTRTGKIMRRVLRSILLNEAVGDVSTCANLESIDSLMSLGK